MLQTSRPVLALRAFLRSAGLTKYLSRVLHPFGIEKLEHRLKSLLLDRLGPQDVLWDVGANVGLFGFAAAERCGKVLTFDPDPWCVQKLRENAPANVEVHPVGFAEKSGSLYFEKSVDSSWGNSHLVDDPSKVPAERLIRVDIWSGDEYREKHQLAMPAAIKIDVEGYELEAVRGLSKTLSDPACRTVMVEMHFTNLAARGVNPDDVVAALRKDGFSNVTFPDASHVFATKA